ncbi:class F sortase [Streptomyces sp. P38-E01]|uniref:Class F sortase n=1 Tax=Streptomyces tardus TaxID=2780544 RepID=A0A949JDM5_9ACTN|nr:class F sortase [Streptomyces tardus]MBU7597492.1 class F sortase [Streptomyces tardus]
MTTRQQRIALRGRRLECAAVVATAVLAATLCGAVPAQDATGSRSERSSERTSVAAGVSRPEAVDTRPPSPDPQAQPRSEPSRVRIPQLGADLEVFGADAEKDGTPPTPEEEDAHKVAWFQGGPSPGEQGPAILVGHLDTHEGPAAFAGIGSLKPGAEIRIERKDQSTMVFTVDSVEQYQKENYPNGRVYGPTQTPQLRLITCGGGFTEKDGYDANIVAFASLKS